MGIALMFLLALTHMQSAIHSEIIEAPSYKENAIVDTEEVVPKANLLEDLLNDKPDQTELEFRYPISAIGIDYGKNSVVLRFQKHPKLGSKFDPDYEMKRRSMQENFMRFGKRQPEQLPRDMGPGFYDPVKRSAKQDFMRFGRSPSDFMRFGRAPTDFMRFGRDPQDFMRFGRSDNFMRFGRNLNFHEDVRSPKQDFMRFGRPDNFMRFGRAAPTDFERYGKMDSNFMRFGKSVNRSGAAEANPSKTQQNKLAADEVKAQATEESNPVDKAISMLYDKHQAHQDQGQGESQVQGQSKSSEQAESEEQFYGQ